MQVRLQQQRPVAGRDRTGGTGTRHLGLDRREFDGLIEHQTNVYNNDRPPVPLRGRADFVTYSLDINAIAL